MSSVMLFILLFSGLCTLSFTLSDLKCQRGWSQLGSRCFRIFKTATNWIDAEKNCVTMGGHLASIHSSEEYAFLEFLVLRATSSYAPMWLGATNVEQESIWVWTDGSAFDYASWAKGQPDNKDHAEHWLMMNYEGGWNDTPLTDLYPSACAKAAIPARIKAVIQLKIITTDTLLESDTEDFVQQVKQKLIDSGMPSNVTLRLQNIYKKQK